MQDTDESAEPSEDASSADELCISCLQPNAPGTNFCEKCGAPLTYYAASAPFESTLARGYIYRQCTGSPQSLIIVIGVWILFGPIAFFGALWLWFTPFGTTSSFFVTISSTVVSALIVFKSTRAYLIRRRDGTPAETERS